MQVLFSLSNAWTAYALQSNSTWPFVTIPHSAQELEPFLSLADASALTVFPIVPRHLRAEWEAYSVKNQHWIDDDLSHSDRPLTTSDENETPEETADTISPYIKNYVGVDTSPGIWLPWWQYAPVIPNRWFVNFNRLAWNGFGAQLETLLQAKATLSETITFVPGLDYQSTRDYAFFDQLLRAGASGQSYNPGEPLSYIFYPILQDFDDGNDPHNPKVVAILSATVNWKSYFQDILPDSAQGIVCVVRNSAGQAFTYQVNGRAAEFLGMQDMHDPQFNHMKLTADYSNFHTANNNNQTKQYTGVPVDDQTISYHIDVYPSVVLQNQYYSQNPVYFALIMASVFVVCALIFCIYNFLVEKRQKLVMETAVLSTTVVESMFPSNVRDRLMNDVGGKGSTQGNSSRRRGSKSSMNAWNNLHSSSGDISVDSQLGASQNNSSQPIADNFEGACVSPRESWCHDFFMPFAGRWVGN